MPMLNLKCIEVTLRKGLSRLNEISQCLLVQYKKISVPKWVYWGGAGLILATVGCLIALFRTPGPTIAGPQIQTIASQLNDVQLTLAHLERALNQTKSQHNGSSDASLQAMGQQFERRQTQSAKAIQSMVYQSQAQLESQIKTLSQAIGSLKQSLHPVTYLKPSALPFRVTALDDIQSQGVVTVFYHAQYQPLTKDDHLAGWTLTQTDFSNQRAEFVNEQGQHVRVTLNKGAHG